MRLRSLVIGSLVTGALLAFGGASASAQTPTPTAPAMAACPTGVTLTLAQQAPGSSTVVTTVTPSINIKPAAEADLTSFHLHYYTDKPIGTLKVGDVVPAGDLQIVHSGATTLDLKLAAGSHTVVVVLGQVGHQACGNASGAVVMATATFTVAAAQATATPTPAPVSATPLPTPVAAAPKTGTAGLASETSSPVAMALLAVMAAAALGGTVFARRRR